MAGEIADFILWPVILLSLIQAAGFFSGPKFTKAAAITVFLALSFCFIALIYSFAVSDFSLKLVYQNSHSAKPLIYKISGAWGNHEGSLLMLVWMISLYGFIYSLREHNNRALAFQGFILLLFALFMKMTSNPFEQLPLVPQDGIGLNPILQDVGLAFHPPILYLGYIGFSVVFSITVAALYENAVNKDYAKAARKWCLFAWSFLTLGIGIGSWWAYRELGWGGFWFWDPVENASLMPLLAGTALMHSLMLTEKGELKKWTTLLAILTFGLCVTGFFLVRSGVLTSVHSFANDPERGVMILLILTLTMGIALLIFSLRAHRLYEKNQKRFTFTLISRDMGMILGNLLLVVLCAVIFIGTLYPLILNWITGNSISVGAPYYSRTFVPIAIALIFLCAFLTSAQWNNDSFGRLWRELRRAFIIAAGVAAVIILIYEADISQAVGIVAAALIIGWAVDYGIRKFTSWDKWSKLGLVFAHGGMGVLTCGIIFAATFDEKNEKMLKVGESMELAGFEIKLQDIEQGQGGNYVYRRGVFEVWRADRQVDTLTPEMRVFPIEGQTTTESSIAAHNIFSDLYVVIGEKNKTGQYAVRAYYKPLMSLIWLGFILIALGGLIKWLKKVI